MGENEELLARLMGQTEAYIKTNIELLKLQFVDKLTKAVASITVILLVLFIISIALIVINFGIAFWLSDMLGKVYAGFFVLGVFYFLMGILLYLFRDKWIKRPMIHKMIAELLK